METKKEKIKKIKDDINKIESNNELDELLTEIYKKKRQNQGGSAGFIGKKK